ncbi:hypothetical protein GUJ93_ZPchr0006g40915 [Zizania palustris]|uniref:Uncharacterized protein n=1 Tax=Zizania palustris TaxID=103762 RepID=A0A8J5TGP9_ZIZPA|nr:hypothetical protein GUJ93_ZPchr0006g40915 [Zizania palustris]
MKKSDDHAFNGPAFVVFAQNYEQHMPESTLLSPSPRRTLLLLPTIVSAWRAPTSPRRDGQMGAVARALHNRLRRREMPSVRVTNRAVQSCVQTINCVQIGRNLSF